MYQFPLRQTERASHGFLLKQTQAKPVCVSNGKTTSINTLSLNMSNGRDLKFHAVPHLTPQIRKAKISIPGHHHSLELLQHQGALPH